MQLTVELLSTGIGTAANASQSQITPQYWAPIFTFIVGLLGIISQISVSYFSEKRKYALEYSRIKNQNVFDFYMPLLVLLRQYKCYREILLKNPAFSILSSVNLGDEDSNAVFQELLALYDPIFDVLKEKYVPTNQKLDNEINKLMEHVIMVRCVRNHRYDEDACRALFQETDVRGYDCGELERLLVEEI